MELPLLLYDLSTSVTAIVVSKTLCKPTFRPVHGPMARLTSTQLGCIFNWEAPTSVVVVGQLPPSPTIKLANVPQNGPWYS